MSERPAIPAELRRRILVEAGHRCAIHTCGHTSVDVHHIIPWEKCKEHSHENLIALCPNCHRRADSGEIDRQALRLYKTRLAAAFEIPENQASTQQKDLDRASWKTQLLTGRSELPPVYQAQVEYPQFEAPTDALERVNSIERGRAVTWLADFETFRLTEWKSDDHWSKQASELSISYEVAYISNEVVSIRYSTFHFGAGAAHPNHTTETRNYQIGMPLLPLTLFHIFRSGTPYIQSLSAYCIESLTKQKGLSRPNQWILEGAGPKAGNFEKFNILPGGLLVTFDEYQVDCYAAGSAQVLVPASELRSYLNPLCIVSKEWITS